MKRFLSLVIILTGLLSGLKASGQTTLFDYPIAPDTCSNIESRCNYSIQHFWDNCNLTKPFEAQNDSLLIEAMMTYFEIMKAGANLNVSLASARNLMFKSQANHDNFLKLMSMAEYLLYYHDFEIIDDVYLAFAQSAADASWLKKDVKEHYAQQVKRITTSKLGQLMPNFEFTAITGARKHLYDVKSGAKIYVLIFSDNDSGSSIERMRLSTDIALGRAVENNDIDIINIVASDTPKKWDNDSQSYSSTWVVGASKDIASKIDLRIMPCIYLLDGDFNIIAKNKTVDFVKKLMQ